MGASFDWQAAVSKHDADWGWGIPIPGMPSLELDFPEQIKFNVIEFREHFPAGQRVESFAVGVELEGKRVNARVEKQSETAPLFG